MTRLESDGRARRSLTWRPAATGLLNVVSSSAFGVFAVLFFPAMVIYGSDTMILQKGGLDPYVYLGYVHAFPELIARYGQTYYSGRIAYILPERLFSIKFGLYAGYIIIRYALFVVACSVVYVIARRRSNAFVALFLIVWLTCVPWLYRSLAWTHYDGFGTVYLIIFLGCLLIPTSQGFFNHFIAGIFVALATNTNLLLLGIAGLFAPSWLILNRGAGWQKLIVWGASALFGFVATYVILNTIYSLYWDGPAPFIEAASLRWTDQVFAGGSSQWVVPIPVLFRDVALAAFFPLLFSLLLVMILISRRIALLSDPFTLAALLYGILVFALYMVLHYVFQTGVLGLFYYTIYLLPASALVIISIGRNINTEYNSSKLYVISLAAIIIILWSIQHYYVDLIHKLSSVVWFCLFLVGCLAFMFPRVPALGVTALVGPWLLSLSLLSMTGSQFSFRTRTADSGAVSTLELDLLRAGIFLHDAVNPMVMRGERLDFWYDNERRIGLDSVQSVYLWGYSRLQPCCEIGAGMPNLPAKTREALERTSVLVLMADVPGAIDAGAAALRSAGIAFDEVGERRFQGQKFQMWLKIIRLKKNPHM